MGSHAARAGRAGGRLPLRGPGQRALHPRAGATRAGARVHEITNAGLFRFEVSPTFHARDVFGPVAGHLAARAAAGRRGARGGATRSCCPRRRPRGWALSEWEADGPARRPLRQPDHQPPIATSCDDDPGRARTATPPALVVVVEGDRCCRSSAPTPTSPRASPARSSAAAGRLEVAVNRGSAARLLGAGRGAPVRAAPGAAARRVRSAVALIAESTASGAVLMHPGAWSSLTWSQWTDPCGKSWWRARCARPSAASAAASPA